MLKLLLKSAAIFLLSTSLWSTELNERTGKVLDHIQSGGYSYIQLQEKDNIIWAAIPETELVKDQIITLNEQMWMEDFESKTLNKTFEKILFATYKDNRYSVNDTRKAEEKQFPTLAGTLKSNVVKEEKQEVILSEAILVSSVKEIKEKKIELKDKTVQIKGKVTKILKAIMKTSWIHLQDEYGDTMIFRANDEDLNIGDNVIATGILNTDVDYGYGYTYEFIIVNSNFLKTK